MFSSIVSIAIPVFITIGGYFTIRALVHFEHAHCLDSEAATRSHRRRAFALLLAGVSSMTIGRVLVELIPDPVNKPHPSIADQTSSPRG